VPHTRLAYFKQTMTYLLFITALGLSAVAAYYSIMGLVAIFAAAATPIFIMGSLLEASKLVVASWLYRSWKEIPRLMKVYFTTALVILMMLTSMGIFGFLSKAHLDQAVPTGDVAAKLSLIDEKIKTEKDNLNASRQELNQLDQQVNQTLNRTTDAAGADRSIAIRRGQQKDRARILNEIGTAQTKIAKLQEERAPIASEVRKVEAEVGPIKYIAQLIYGQEAQDADFLEKAVRIVILMIVAVFDPLAVLLLVAANWQMRHEDKGRWTDFFNKEKVEDFPETKEIIVEDNINLDDNPSVETDEELIFDEPEPKVKNWDPSFYTDANQTLGINSTEKELGRYETELLEQEKKRKVQSFLTKVGEIEQEVEDLQKRNN
jgi:hypothetical protein